MHVEKSLNSYGNGKNPKNQNQLNKTKDVAWEKTQHMLKKKKTSTDF